MNSRAIFTVSELNRHVKSFLENEIGYIQVEGEVSNLSKPASGHLYFSLKDASAQVRCVFFKNRGMARPSSATNFDSPSPHPPSGHLLPMSGAKGTMNQVLREHPSPHSFLPMSGAKGTVTELRDGQHVVVLGKLSLYEARGDYQLIVEQLSDAGLGALYQKFEELKNKLAAEGLFATARKKTIPAIPTTIGIIASATSAALQDILSTLARRFPIAKILIYPSEVQGASAPMQLIRALTQANQEQRCDVLILARGGGSIEDLWAFNDEQLARHIAASSIPIVSGVGHETDFTIADFVADFRAETPTAAANAVTPDCLELLQRLDYTERQLLANIRVFLRHQHHRLHLLSAQLNVHNPKTQIARTKMRTQQLLQLLQQHMRKQLNQLKLQLNSCLSTLHAVSPLATLDRGYAIASKQEKVLYSAKSVQLGDTIDLRLAEGALECAVTAIRES